MNNHFPPMNGFLHSPRIVLLGLILTLGVGLLALLSPSVPVRSPLVPGVAGVVTGPTGPLEGARVRYQGTAVLTRTDTQGRFHLPHHPSAAIITASQPGFFIGGVELSPFARLQLPPLPRHDNPNYEWVDPAPGPGKHQCANCHEEIYREWSASGHAQAANGKHFRNLYEGTNWKGKPGVSWGLRTEYPDGEGVCTACHAPSVSAESPGFVDLRQLSGVALKGVHCDYCHKIADVGTDNLGLTHGRYNLTLLRPQKGHQLFLGPLDDAIGGLTRLSPRSGEGLANGQDEDVYSPLYHQSKYCASCHEGTVFGIHVYSTYTEWLASPARRRGLQCQDCHMTPTGKMTNVAPGKGGIERDPRTLANHRFFEGSKMDMLRGCVRLKTQFHRRQDGVQATVHLRVIGVGHRVPTGFIDRHLLLVVTGTDARKRVLPPRSGPRLPFAAGKELQNQPGQLYARLLRDEKGQSPVPFWRSAFEPVDTRLTPGTQETVRWIFPHTLQALRVRLIYRPFWKEVQQAKGWPDQDRVVEDRTFRLAQPSGGMKVGQRSPH